MTIWVKNLNGTTGKRCSSCGTWLDHWRNIARSNRLLCGALGCGNAAEVGAHVLNAHGNAGRQHYVVPFCRSCNGTPDEIPLKQGVALVEATPC